MQLRTHTCFTNFCKKTKKTFKIAIFVANIALSINFPKTGVPLDNHLRPPRGTRPPGWEPLV